MRVFDETKTIELKEYDLTKGYLTIDRLFVAHHDELQATQEIGHYEVIAEYPNGGKDLTWVVDTPAVKARSAYDEYEDIQVYIPYTEAELAAFEIAELKNKLAATDYRAIKYAEGVLSSDEYAPFKEERQAWRNRIGELEVILCDAKS